MERALEEEWLVLIVVPVFFCAVLTWRDNLLLKHRRDVKGRGAPFYGRVGSDDGRIWT